MEPDLSLAVRRGPGEPAGRRRQRNFDSEERKSYPRRRGILAGNLAVDSIHVIVWE
jgi:hypothetical protein